VVWLV